MFEELRIAHGDGSFGKRLAALAKTDLIILDDWAIAPLVQAERNDLMGILDDRVDPFDPDHEPVADRALACVSERSYLGRRHPRSRVRHAAHKVASVGESQRKPENPSACTASC